MPAPFALCLLLAGCITDPGFTIDVSNSSNETFYVGSASMGVYRVPPRSFGLGPSDLGEVSEPMWLFDDRCNIVLSLGRLRAGNYVVAIAEDASASLVAVDSASAGTSQSLPDVGSLDRSDQCGG